MNPTTFEPLRQSGRQMRSPQSRAYLHPEPAKSRPCGLWSLRMTTSRPFAPLIGLFFRRHRDFTRHSSVFFPQVVVDPAFGDACDTNDTRNRDLFQQELVNEIPFFGRNELFDGLLDKLALAIFADATLLSSMDFAVSDGLRRLAAWTDGLHKHPHFLQLTTATITYAALPKFHLLEMNLS